MGFTGYGLSAIIAKGFTMVNPRGKCFGSRVQVLFSSLPVTMFGLFPIFQVHDGVSVTACILQMWASAEWALSNWRSFG